MKKRFLTVISFALCLSFVLSVIACSSVEDPINTDTSSDIFSDTVKNETEKKTEKKTEKSTKKTTAKKETEPIPGKTVAPIKLTTKEYDLSRKTNYFKTVGRVQQTTTGITFDHCANVLEFQGYMTGELKLNANSSGGNKYEWTYYTVFIDGERVDQRFVIDGNDKTITIANFSGNYFHTVRIVKQTELANSDSRLKKIILTGYLIEAPKDRKYYFEFYGDSLTAAYGNIGKPGDSNAGSSLHQDATKSYAFLASEALDADCSILAKSGVGLQTGYSSEPFINFFSKESYVRGSEKFNFTGARVPDVVVIHLGANDSTHTTTKSQFINRATELINYIQNGYNKKMPIIWAYDPSECVSISWMKEVLNNFGGEAKGYYLIELEWRSIGAGAGGHPGVKAHETHAKLICDLIKNKQLLK